jgi:dipeptidase D
MGNVLGNLEPKLVWELFEEITKVPRPSKKEGKILDWMKKFAEENNLEWQQDELGNLVIRKPATPGMENRKGVVIQGHLDMVCEKNSDVEFDFDNDPIQVYVDGDWVKAKGTTLGADNGIGLAMGLALLKSTDIPHPPLELLCTLDEETGLTGAMQLGTDLIKSDILINLDSEEDGAFTIGCAGGMNTSATYKFEGEAVPENHVAYNINLTGLQGGHSGIEIHDGRANAIKLLNRILWTYTDKFDFRVASITAGSAHNAIPREAFATVTVAKADEQAFLDSIKECYETYKQEWLSKEPSISLEAVPTDMPGKVMTKDFQKKLTSSLYAVPHGPLRYSPDIEGLVQTSTNLATIETRENEIFVLTSQRSSVETEKIDMANMVRCAFELGGAEVEHGDGYPAWQPNVNSEILNLAKDLFVKMFGKEPVIEAIHAGLECGLIGEKYPGIDMLSFGPNLKDVHSPDEKVQISTVVKAWNLLKEIIQNIPEKK